MKKPASLRAAIIAALPDLRAKPDDLRIYMRKGRIISRDGPALGFQYRYTVVIELIDFAGDPDSLFVAVLLWARRNQPDLIQAHGEKAGFRFDADPLSPTAVDIVIEIELDESVATRPRDEGGLELVHIDEPKREDVFNPILDDDASLGRPLLQQIWLGDQLIVTTSTGDDDE